VTGVGRGLHSRLICSDSYVYLHHRWRGRKKEKEGGVRGTYLVARSFSPPPSFHPALAPAATRVKKSGETARRFPHRTSSILCNRKREEEKELPARVKHASRV